MDRAWTAMPIHATIFGNALSAAPHLLTGKLRAEATAALAAAQQRLMKIESHAARERAAAALKRERLLFNQWQDLHGLSSDIACLNPPLLARAADFPQAASRPQEFGAAAFPERDTTLLRFSSAARITPSHVVQRLELFHGGLAPDVPGSGVLASGRGERILGD